TIIPHLSFPRFLETSSSDSSLLPSTSSSIASAFGPQHNQDDVTSVFLHNRLELLHCPGTNNHIVFFPTGENSDQVGFLPLSLKNSCLEVKADENGDVFVTSCRFNHRILRISVNPVVDSASRGNSFRAVGYLLAFTMYSVHWFVVKVREIGSDSMVPSLTYVGAKFFKTCCVAHACWSPHIPEESIVLLESGALFLFDLESVLSADSTIRYCKGTKLKVSWDDSSNLGDLKWLSCEFSWHPRIFIVARSDAVFIVDLRLDQCNITCLVKLEMLHMYTQVKNEQFFALTKAGSDGFRFALASHSLLILCDVRKPLMPVLQWTHAVAKPSYISVFRLADLRSNLRDGMYKSSSESGFGIILGSFWNPVFNLFCYGPFVAQSGSTVSKAKEFSKPFYAWNRPSDLLLSRNECHCGSCLVKEELLKDALPAWNDWQHKKELVLGFGILNKNISSMLSESDEFGSFTLVRLMSTGKLESQRYSASWGYIKSLLPHRNLSKFEDRYMGSIFDEEYRFPRKSKHLELDYLYGYLDTNLDQVLVAKTKSTSKGPRAEQSFTAEFHKILCEKLSAFGLSQLGSSSKVSVVFDDISLPSSIHEVALRRLWSHLPVQVLQLAFSSSSESLQVLMDGKKASLEFLVVSEKTQLPPFFLRKSSWRSNKSSQKVPRADALVGPTLPLPILLALHKYHNGSPSLDKSSSCFAVEAEVRLQCDEVMKAACEMAASDSSGDGAVSLANDANDNEERSAGSKRAKPFLLHHPSSLDRGVLDHTKEQSVYKDETFSTLISKVHEKEHASSVKN
ncbi:TATA box-binding protein associated factor RNA polymerase I subunit C, partial [Parasponia andersonii]